MESDKGNSDNPVDPAPTESKGPSTGAESSAPIQSEHEPTPAPGVRDGVIKGTVTDSDKGPAAGSPKSDEHPDAKKFSDINANIVNVIGQVVVQKEGDQPKDKKRKTIELDQLTLVDLKLEILKKAYDVFVAPPAYSGLGDRDLGSDENRIFLISGPEHSGKFTCAINLGLKLRGEQQISNAKFRVYKHATHNIGALSLYDFIQRIDLDDDTVYIVRNVFESGLDAEDLSSPHLLASIRDTLRKKNCHLVLTTNRPKSQLEAYPVSKISIEIEEEAGNNFTSEVYDRHLKYYGYKLERISPQIMALASDQGTKSTILNSLKQPLQIDRFCFKLEELPPAADAQHFITLASVVESIGREPARMWFKQLSENEKLYAMLLVLFDGIERITLDDLYVMAVQRLRNKGEVSTLRDAREFNLAEILDHLRAQETETRTIQFSVSAYREEVRRQIPNYHHLLWSLIDLLLLDLIEIYKAPEYWEFRRALGSAIGQLGSDRLNKLYPILEMIARHSSGGVVAVAGYALDAICRLGPEYYSRVTRWLDDWVKSRDPDLMWAAGASIWRIYDGVARAAHADGDASSNTKQAHEALGQIRAILSKLSETLDQFNERARLTALNNALSKGSDESAPPEYVGQEIAERVLQQLEIWAADNAKSVLHAIRQIALNNAKDVVDLITDWLGKDNENLHEIGRLAGYQLFRENDDTDIKLIEDRHRPLLSLVAPLLATDDDTIDAAISTLRAWLINPGWTNTIHEALLKTVNRARGNRASALRASISRQWLDSDAEEVVRRVGRSLITRSYILDGTPVVPSSQRHGVIILDGSREANFNKTCARAGRKLYERIDPQIDVRILKMGRAVAVAQPNQLISTADLWSDHALPRLVVPALEGLDKSKVSFAVILTLGPVADLEDVMPEDWIDQLIIASPNKPIELSQKITQVSIDSRLSNEASLNAIERAIKKQLARVVTSITSDEWRSSLSEAIQGDSVNLSETANKLEAWIEKLDQVESAQNSDDFARSVVSAVLWMASLNLESCLQVVKKWLSDEREIFRVMGEACGKTLYHTFGDLEPPPSHQSHAILLSIAPMLAKQSWDGVKAVLYAARRWVAKPEWFDRLLAAPDHSIGELFQVVDAAATEHRDALQKLLKEWDAPLPTEPVASKLATVSSLGDRLRLRLALGTREPLVTLPDGHVLGIIVLDISTRDERVRNHLDNVTVNLINRLRGLNRNDLDIAVYYLGSNYLVAGPGEKPTRQSLEPATLQAPLLNPLLDRYTPGQVRFIVALTRNPIIDQEDWQDSDWGKRVLIYYYADHPGPAQSIVTIPKQVEPSQAEQAIFNQLKPRLGA